MTSGRVEAALHSMLYYPLVQPSRSVLAQGILYWDEIGSLVPPVYDFPDDLSYLRGEGIYRPLHPDNYSDSDFVQHLRTDVEELLDRIPPEQFEIPTGLPSSQTRLYYGKLPSALEAELLDYGVLRPDGPALAASPALLLPLIALLARAVSEAEPLPTRRWISHTDVRGAYELAYAKGGVGAERSWRLDLGYLFPVPREDTIVRDLVEFRRKHDDERMELVTAVDSLVRELGGNANPDLLPELAEKVQVARKRVGQAGRSRNIAWSKVVIYGFFGAAAGVLSGVPGLGAVSSMLLAASSASMRRRGASDPYTYLHRIDKAVAAQRHL